jgi:hypothetical protein
VTGVEEQYVRTFTDNWSGTGAISGEDDEEKISLEGGQYMETDDVVHTGLVTVTIQKNKYGTGDALVNLKWRRGATVEETMLAEWNVYSAPFESTGYVQVRVEV